MKHRCPVCKQDTMIWCHRTSVNDHNFSECGEGSCACGPWEVCCKCSIEMLRTSGFMLLEDEVFSDLEGRILN